MDHLATPQQDVFDSTRVSFIDRNDGLEFLLFVLCRCCVFTTLPTHSQADIMFAVVSIAGFQERVREGDTLSVPLLPSGKNETVTFKEVLLLLKEGGDVVLGKPFIAGATVEAKILDHGRGEKIRVYKMRRRKRYQRTHGHRQWYTKIQITKIIA